MPRRAPPPPPFFVGDRVTMPSSLGPVACRVTAVLQDASGAWTQVHGVCDNGGGHYASPPANVTRGWLPEARR